MRLALVTAMLADADLYLLDEPTNHLDLSATAWLQEYLIGEGRDSTTIIVSHDHCFLNNVCTDIIHFTAEGKLEYHDGNLDDFFLRQRLVSASARADFTAPHAEAVQGQKL